MMHRNSILVFERYVVPLARDGWRVLEVGVGNHRNTAASGAIAKLAKIDFFFCDLRNRNATRSNFIRQPSDYCIDAPNDGFDLVYSTNVLEHVACPWLWFPEQARLVKPGGLLACVAPVTWEEHRKPLDAFRVRSDGMRWLLLYSGLTPIVTWHGTLDDSGVDRRHNIGGVDPVDVVGVGQKPLC